MKGARKALSLGYHSQLAFDVCRSPKGNFICADCARSLRREISLRRHASSGVREFASHGVKSHQVRLVDRVQQYHKSSKQAAAVEHHITPGSDGDFLSVEQLARAPHDRPGDTVPSIRQRLKKWRKENDSPDTIAAGADTMIQLPALNSIGEEGLENSALEEHADHESDLLREYKGDLAVPQMMLLPGDLAQVVLPGIGNPNESICIFVRMVEGQGQYITSRGFWYVTAIHQLSGGKIEHFVSPEELAPIIPYLPDTPVHETGAGTMPKPVNKLGTVPITVAAPIVSKMQQLQDDTDAFRRKHALAFDGLYNKLADDKDLVEWSLDDLVPKVFGFPRSELPNAGLLALDRFGSQKVNGLYSLRSRGKLAGFWVRSRKDMLMKSRVTDWARMYQESAAQAAAGKDVKEELRKNPLSAFITKAHRLILKSRQIRSPTTIGVLGPSAERGGDDAVHAVDTGETLTEDDRTIVKYMFDVTQTNPSLAPDEAISICALIYRAVGAYPNLPLGVKVARLLLQELGVISPWAYPAFNTFNLRLPGVGLWPYQDKLVAKAEASCKELNTLRDTVHHARKDWGQMPVYCIDSFDAMEIDDGISIEPDRHNPDRAWIHVHTANPAAYITPDHPIAVAARDILTSTYTPSKKFSMMPQDFVQTLASLRADRAVMTVSTLLKTDGSVADIKMSLGIVHNIVKLTPAAVNGQLERPFEMATMVVGGERPFQDDGKGSEALSQALPDLRLMRQFLHSRFSQRWKDWPEEEQIKRKLSVLSTDAWTSVREERSAFSGKLSHWKGDPVIVVEGERFPRDANGFEFMPVVDHAMLLAGESAAKWCKDREIPILFHAALPDPNYPVSKLNQLKDTDFRIEPIGKLSSKPQPHWILRMWQYARVTSPMRRYVDLVNQWQIQAYLNAVSCYSKDQQLPEPLSTLPFTRQKLDDTIDKISDRLPILKSIAHSGKSHWIVQAFFRAFHFKEAVLPEIWDFKVIGPRKNHLTTSLDIAGIWGFLSPFQASAELLSSKEGWEKDVQRSQYLPVKIEVADAEYNKIFVRAVGPPSDTPITTQPIHIRSSKRSALHGKNGGEAQQS